MNTHHRLDTPALDRDLDYLIVPIETIENVEAGRSRNQP